MKNLAPGCLGKEKGDEILSSYIGILTNLDPTIPIKQPGFNVR